MAEIRDRIHRRLTDAERQRHQRIREQAERDRPLLDNRAAAKQAELASLR